MEPVKVFIDTNVVLDYFTGRMGDNNAETIVQIGQSPQFDLCISLLSVVNVLYVARKYAPSLKPSDISRLFTILPQDYQQYCNAQTYDLEDFEDAVQIACASQNGCKAIVSRDRRLLELSCLSYPAVYSPEEFIEAVTH
ncbi:MAG: PIN domain-containing protein [Bacteroidales bacterium]|nr:PIN domain-containing protein [Bacteroidales bacterium]